MPHPGSRAAPSAFSVDEHALTEDSLEPIEVLDVFDKTYNSSETDGIVTKQDPAPYIIGPEEIGRIYGNKEWDKVLHDLCSDTPPLSAEEQALVLDVLAEENTPVQVIDLLRPWIDSIKTRHVQQVFKQMLLRLSTRDLQQAIRVCALRDDDPDRRLLKYLFTHMTTRYRSTHNLDLLMSSLDSATHVNPAALLVLYNNAMDATLRQRKHEHLEVLTQRMKDLGLEPDAVTYNIFIRSQLMTGKKPSSVAAATQLYHDMVRAGIPPSPATYNMFINHMARRMRWSEMRQWLHRLLTHSSANSITLRILLSAAKVHKNTPQLVKAIERVAKVVPLHTSDGLLETAVIALLRHDRTELALSILKSSLQQKAKDNAMPSICTYNLLLHAMIKKGDLEGAHDVFDSMVRQDAGVRIPGPDVVSFTTLIHGYANGSSPDPAGLQIIQSLYRQMLSLNLEPNAALQSVLLHALAKQENASPQQLSGLFHLMVSQQKDRTYRGTTSTTILYNIMMKAHLLHAKYANASSSSSRIIPLQAVALLKEAIDRGTINHGTLNVWVRALAVYQKDYIGAEKFIEWFASTGIDADESTVAIMTKAAQARGWHGSARYWSNRLSRVDGTGLGFW
ncbi:hypothetical protein BCR43DRAFT_566961 [Syncephalastrum racemosum]|uniref:Pentacotripeptide-repeat region of PRORP domain-containing protein n=1 Tax=Syncephalastrum racemosum TaxID=13706 RepID=A0A1X2GZY6_SYNRA|nr:hypothetical protein BCR43DRAFT_566961 [Syncephalastrum racemosum]